MPISDLSRSAVRVTLAFAAVLAVAAAADAQDSQQTPRSNPWAVFKFGFSAYKSGHKDQAVEAYRYAAENGQIGATWKLARMYAEGDGVTRDDYEAYKFFNEIAEQDVEPGSPEESYVSDALVALGGYLKQGIPGSPVAANPAAAQEYYMRAAANYRNVLVTEEEAITGGTPGDAVSGQPVLTRKPELAVARAHGQDHRTRGERVAVAVLDDLDIAGQIDLGNVLGDQLGPEPLGLRTQLVHQLRPHDAVREAREILDVSGRHQGSASVDLTLEDQRLQIRPSRINGCRVTGRPTPDDDDIPYGFVAHGALRDSLRGDV